MKYYYEVDAVKFDGTKECLLPITDCAEVDYVGGGEYRVAIGGQVCEVEVGDYIGKDQDDDFFGTKKATFESSYKCRPQFKKGKISNNFMELCTNNREKIERLLELGVISDGKDNVRDHNVGKSNYSKHTIQAWSVWMDWGLNPWDADIVKRVERTKEGESEIEKYDKIEHICQERKRQLKHEKHEG